MTYQSTGELNGCAKLKERDVREIRELGNYIYQHEVAKAYGVSKMLISLILRRKLWCHI